MTPGEIEGLSFRIIDQEAEHHDFDPRQWKIVRRMIHTSADFDYLKSVSFHEKAVSQGIKAIQSGCTIITDTTMALFPDIIKEGFIQIGDFFKDPLDSALAEKGICSVTLTMFFGKAVKMAMGFPHTHAAKSALTQEGLSRWAHSITQDKDLACNIRDANTARQAFGLIYPCHPAVISHIGRKIIESADRFSGNQLTIRCVILDFNGRPVIDMNRAQE
ncbi:MAG: precorrin-8X methylmutase [Thermodesulfobacteriota bacterium]|nr:precorrin-8X methylmutase [Thermodesulfobacteriota bacterium]